MFVVGLRKLKELKDNVASKGLSLSTVVGGVGSFWKSSLGQLGQTLKPPRPDDRKVVVFFIVGGVTTAEVRELQELAAQQQRVQVLVGSTQLATAQSMLAHVFF